MSPEPPQRVLVVDDEPDIAGLVAYHLAKAGYRVSTAADGAEAFARARAERPDLVVLDLMLPGRSGLDVLADLRRNDETQQMGVILLTARKEEQDRIKGLSLGADDYLDIQTRTVDMHVQCLRTKLGAAGGLRPHVTPLEVRSSPCTANCRPA